MHPFGVKHIIFRTPCRAKNGIVVVVYTQYMVHERNGKTLDAGIISLIVAFFILLAGSAFFSASETAFSSLNRIRLKSLVLEGNKKADRALALSNEFDKVLSSILIGNNIVNIASTSLATVLFVRLFGNWGVTLATIITAVLVLLFGEISPKTLAKESPEQFAMLAAPVLRVFLVVLSPINWVLGKWKKLILKLFRIKPDHSISEQELLTYVEEVRQEGGINEQEEELIRQVIEFDDLRAIDIFTPRVDIEAVPDDATFKEVADKFHETGYSRLPVYHDSLDDIIGVVLQKDLHLVLENPQLTLASITKPIVYITKTVKISELLGMLQQKKMHIAVIVDEFGGTMGIVTVEDIVEEIVGEIWDEHDDVIQDIRPLQDGHVQVEGNTDLEDFADYFDLEHLKQEHSAATVGGWAVEQLGHIAAEGECFVYEHLECTVTKVVRHRIMELLVWQNTPQEPAEEQ